MLANIGWMNEWKQNTADQSSTPWFQNKIICSCCLTLSGCPPQEQDCPGRVWLLPAWFGDQPQSRHCSPRPGCWLVVRLRVHSVQLHRPILKFWGQDLLVTLWLLHIHSCLFGLLRGLNEESWSLHCVFEYVWWGQKKTKASELGLNPQATTKSSQSSTQTSLGCATS